jgi:LPXTG-motif cell wall-anchored protein
VAAHTPHEAASQAVQATPAALAIGADLVFGVTPERWLTYLGIAFLVLQAAYLLWKWRKEAKGAK